MTYDSRTVSFHTLGCKLNFAETSEIGRALAARGWRRAGEGEPPSLVVVNTCSVTEVADKKGRALVRHLHRLWPQAKIVVTGCYAQLKPEEVASLPGVSAVLGQDQKGRMDKWVEELEQTQLTTTAVKDFRELREFVPACERGERTRYWLKVQDGCDYWCSYCTIPRARGRSRSATIEKVMEQARRAAAEGGREIVLTGVNVGCFGRERGESLLDLLQALDRVQEIERYRISSIEPNLLTPEIIGFVASSRAFMPHFHLPLQSGSDAVLRLMRRRYDTALFAARVEAIRSLMPDAFIGVDVIAGSRGETEQEWRRSVEFIDGLDVTRLHVFPYSERPGTTALSLEGAVEKPVKDTRVRELLALSNGKLETFLKRMRGQVRPVLWEACDGTQMTGHTDNYVRVSAQLRPDLLGTISPVRLGAVVMETESMEGTHE